MMKIQFLNNLPMKFSRNHHPTNHFKRFISFYCILFYAYCSVGEQQAQRYKSSHGKPLEKNRNMKKKKKLNFCWKKIYDKNGEQKASGLWELAFCSQAKSNEILARRTQSNCINSNFIYES